MDAYENAAIGSYMCKCVENMADTVVVHGCRSFPFVDSVVGIVDGVLQHNVGTTVRY
jgi:hypothetical protein